MLDRTDRQAAQPGLPFDPPAAHLAGGDPDRLWRQVSLRIYELHGVFASRPASDGRSHLDVLLDEFEGDLEAALAGVDVAFGCAYFAAYMLSQKDQSPEGLGRDWLAVLINWAAHCTSEEALLIEAASHNLPGSKKALEGLRARAGAA